MKVIVGASAADTTEHALRVVRNLQAYEDGQKHPANVIPRNVPVHKAKIPNECDECGETFWASDQWASHAGCTGRKKGAGFQ